MKLSIVIPTRERKEYLARSVRTALAVKSDKVEIVVSDNASCDGTGEMLAAITDPRFVYTNTGARVSMRANFENGLKASSGDYILFIGDDDGILPGQIPTLIKLLETKQPDSMKWSVVRYTWPEENKRKSGTLRLRKSGVFGDLSPIDLDKLLFDIAHCDMSNIDMHPTIYHGVMSRQFLQRAMTKDGQFFNCSIPDIFSAFLAIFQGGNHLFCGHPFSINGDSAASNGSSQNKIGQSDAPPDIAARFITENDTDQSLDVADFGSTLPASFFLALETARLVSGRPVEEVDYDSWFTHLAKEASAMQQTPRTKLLDALSNYARSIGKEAALGRALNVADIPEKSLQRFKKKLFKPREFQRIRFSCEHEGENTILTAARLCDMHLADDIDKTLFQGKSAGAAWRDLKVRYRQLA